MTDLSKTLTSEFDCAPIFARRVLFWNFALAWLTNILVLELNHKFKKTKNFSFTRLQVLILSSKKTVTEEKRSCYVIVVFNSLSGAF